MSDRAPVLPRSGLYECRVLHERFSPRPHRFVYRLFYFALDLDELPTLSRRLRLFALNRANVFSFREADFLPTTEPVHHPTGAARATASAASASSLKARVVAYCADHGIALGPEPRVMLVTLPRVLGYQFNPVSFYFCAHGDGTPACALAEVTNTFREVKPYLLSLAASGSGRPRFHLRTPKHFYVSPFSSLDLDFDFTLLEPDARLAVRIDDYAGTTRVLHTTLTGRRMPLGDRRLAWFLVKYPFVTLGITARIHWQALRLWWRRVPWFSKADAPCDQRDLYRPHSSLASPPPA